MDHTKPNAVLFVVMGLFGSTIEFAATLLPFGLTVSLILSGRDAFVHLDERDTP